MLYEILVPRAVPKLVVTNVSEEGCVNIPAGVVLKADVKSLTGLICDGKINIWIFAITSGSLEEKMGSAFASIWYEMTGLASDCSAFSRNWCSMQPILLGTSRPSKK